MTESLKRKLSCERNYKSYNAENGSSIMQALKITTIGNSAGIVLPKEILEKLRVSKGDMLYLSEETDGYKITPYNKEFIEQMDLAEQIMREDRDVLKVLSK
jgi:putative addiction module antidote